MEISVIQPKLKDEIFGLKARPHLLHETVLMQLANRRAGTAATKSKGFVRGGGKKPWRQKGTGRARAGSIRSPLWRGGGVVFGPMPRSYAFRMPKKERRVALCSALSLKVRDEVFRIVDQLALPQPKTRQVVELLQRFAAPPKVLLLVGEPQEYLSLSARNIPQVKVLPVAGLNVYDLLHSTMVICAEDAIEKITGRLG